MSAHFKPRPQDEAHIGAVPLVAHLDGVPPGTEALILPDSFNIVVESKAIEPVGNQTLAVGTTWPKVSLVRSASVDAPIPS